MIVAFPRPIAHILSVLSRLSGASERRAARAEADLLALRRIVAGFEPLPPRDVLEAHYAAGGSIRALTTDDRLTHAHRGVPMPGVFKRLWFLNERGEVSEPLAKPTCACGHTYEKHAHPARAWCVCCRRDCPRTPWS